MFDQHLALTVKQPWAWAIINAGKDIENRSWITHYRGRLYIHAGKRIDHAALPVVAALTDITLEPDQLETGGLIGHVDLTAIRPSESIWAQPDQQHWHLANPTAVSFEPMRGNMGLFRIGPDPQLDLF